MENETEAILKRMEECRRSGRVRSMEELRELSPGMKDEEIWRVVLGFGSSKSKKPQGKGGK